jgi:hypothetical protein
MSIFATKILLATDGREDSDLAHSDPEGGTTGAGDPAELYDVQPVRYATHRALYLARPDLLNYCALSLVTRIAVAGGSRTARDRARLAEVSTDKNLEGYHGEYGEGEDDRHEVA